MPMCPWLSGFLFTAAPDWIGQHWKIAIRKFNTAPPSLPLVDLPFSFAFDSLFLPLAISAEIFH
jgi:uncharacterized protein YceK